MLKKISNTKWLDPKQITDHKSLKVFGNALYRPQLWRLTRRSVSRAFFVGLFSAFVPMPCQMVLAAGLAMITRANLPLAVALVWITNPLTMPMLFYIAYLIGKKILQAPDHEFSFELSWQWWLEQLDYTVKPFLFGSLFMGIVLGIICSVLVRLIWRYYTIRTRKKRRLRMALSS